MPSHRFQSRVQVMPSVAGSLMSIESLRVAITTCGSSRTRDGSETLPILHNPAFMKLCTRLINDQHAMHATPDCPVGERPFTTTKAVSLFSSCIDRSELPWIFD